MYHEDLQQRKPVVFLEPAEFSVERVFPIRNLVADTISAPQGPIVDGQQGHEPPVGAGPHGEEGEGKGQTSSSADQSIRPHPKAGEPSRPEVIHEATHASPLYPSIPLDETIRRLPSLYSGVDYPKSQGNEKGRLISQRAQLVPSESGPPGVMPGKIDNVQPTFFRCEDEPIHTPGAVQQFGALVALRKDGEGHLEVRICSENTQHIFGYSPEGLFGLKSLLDILDQEFQEELVSRVAYALENDSTPNENTHLDVFPVVILPPDGSRIHLWCVVHLAENSKDLVICEFEDYSDVFYLKNPDAAMFLPAIPTASVDIEVSPEEMKKSITSGSKPLRALQLAKQRKQTEFSSMDIFNAMTQAQEQLATSNSVQQVFDVVVGLISELTGFHRVMFYRFDEQLNGCVEAELLNPQASSDLFRGLRYPAADIPKQARELYKKNRVRILYDRDAETARLVCREASDFVSPLDLTHSYLRAMSPIHLKYLGNMGVRSSMSISIVINSELWGLIACHEYGDLGLRVSLPIRELCRNIGGCAATNVERLLMLQRIEARKPPTLDPPTQSPAGFIAASSADLLRSFDASFGLLSIQDEARAIGRLDPYREALVVLRYLQSRRLTTIVSSQNIGEDFPDINYEPGIHAIAGLLLIPLSIGGHDFLVFFRKGQLREVQWAGNPYEKIVRPGSQYLEPRTSFTRWIETVVGRSTEWIEDQLATATILSHLYGKFIEIWRQMESASQKSRMTRLLIRNSSHEVRTPLNAIVNYLEMALENKLEDSTRDLLEKAHKESRSLIYVIDDLLNLTKAEDGPINRLGDTFDLGATVSDVITAFRKEAMRKGLDLTVSTHLGIPEMVRGDPSRLRQVLSNVTSNAFQHSNQGGIKVDMRPIRTHDTTSIVSISVQDAGVGMSESQLDDLFQEFEQVVDEDSRTLSTDNTPSGNDNSRSLGVGLAVVARYIRNTHGQIRVNSEPGKGTIFVLEIPFEHASPASIRRLSSFPADHLSLPRTLSDTSSPSISLPHHKGKALLEKGQGKTLGHSSGSPPENEHHANRNPGFPSSGFPSAGLSSHSLESGGSKFPFPDMDSDPASTPRGLSVLIAEDNPINVRLLTRRLLKLGHEVEIAYDGQECHDHFTSKPHKIDVILMDIQMPLVDGAEATKMIRKFEKDLQDLLLARPRVPIIAVSASLTEDNRFEYVQNGFDGWILKPIDFGRLDFLLQGIRDRQLRCEALYVPSQWKRGGWFLA